MPLPLCRGPALVGEGAASSCRPAACGGRAVHLPPSSNAHAASHRRSLAAPAAYNRNVTPPDAPKDDKPKPGGREWMGTILSRFGPVKDKAQNTATLEFEKPLLELDKRIKEVRPSCPLPACVAGVSRRGGMAVSLPRICQALVCVHTLHARRASTLRKHGPKARTRGVHRPQVRKVAEENGVDVSASIKELEQRARQVLADARAPQHARPRMGAHVI